MQISKDNGWKYRDGAQVEDNSFEIIEKADY